MRISAPTLLLAAFLLSCSAHVLSQVELVFSQGEILYQDTLDDASHWVVEQMPGGSASVKDGILEIDDAKGCTVWFKEKLSGPILIEYEATMIQAGGPNDNARDLNCFWMAVDPKYPTDLFRNASQWLSLRVSTQGARICSRNHLS